MLLRNRERHGRSHARLAIFATASLIFVAAAAIISRVSADINDVEQAISEGLVIGITPDAEPEDCSNSRTGYETASTYEKSCFYKKYNDLGAIGSFHLIGLTQINGALYIHGNVLTKSLTNAQKLGVPDLPEINYISEDIATTPYFFDNSQGSIIALGQSIVVKRSTNYPYDDAIYISSPTNNAELEYGRGIRHPIGSYDETFWQDYTANFMDMNQLRAEAIQYNQDTRNKYLNPDPDDPDYPNIATEESTCTAGYSYEDGMTCNVNDTDKVSYVNLNANSSTIYQESYGPVEHKVFTPEGQISKVVINGAAPEKTFLLNIDAKNLPAVNLGNITINLTDGSCINGSCEDNHAISDYAETAETNFVINIYDSSDPEGLYRGTVSGGNMFGMIIAPGATFTASSLRGTVIADNIGYIGNSYQSNFVGRLIQFPKKVTVHHINPDGSSFANDEEFEFDIGEPYSVSPITPHDGYTVSVREEAGDSPESDDAMPDHDIEVTFIYTPITYTFTVHHYYENTTTSYKPDHVEHLNSGDPYEALPDTSSQNYEYYLKTGDVATGTIDDSDVEVTYYYKKKVATLTVTHIVDGSTVYVGTSDIEWGEEVPRDSFLPAYTDSHNHTVTVDPDVTTVSGDVAVTYTYTRKMFSYVVHHYLESTTTSLYPDDTGTYGYGSSYTTSPITENQNYEGYIRNGDSASGTIGGPVEIVYYYRKKTATLTIIDVIDGVSTTRSSDTVEWGDPVARDEYLPAYTDSHTRSVSVVPDVTVVAGDVTVTYTYNIKTFNLVVHHVNDDANYSQFAEDESTPNIPYGTPYNTSPINDENYTVALKEGSDPASSTGITKNTEVTYVYTRKMATVTAVHVDSATGQKLRNDVIQQNIPWGTTYVTVPHADLTTNYTYTTDISETGNVNAYNITVTYTYTKKTATLTIIDVVDGVSTTRSATTVEWGDNVARDEFLPAYADSHDHSVSVSPDVATVSGDVTVTYTYTIKTFNFTVHHYLDGTTTNYKPDYTKTINYGGSYTATPDTSDNNYEYHLKDGDSATGTVYSDTTVTYYYKKKTATFKIIDIVDGVENERSSVTKEWGDPYEATPLANLADSHTYTVSGGSENGTIAGDVTITYTYTINSYLFTVHHYYDGSTTSYKPDYTENLNHGATYTATPDTSDNTYEYYLKEGDSATGTMSGSTTVTYYYKKKTATLTVIDVVDGVSTTRTTETVEWGSTIIRDDFLSQYNESHNHSVSVNPDVDTVAGNVTVTYTYNKKDVVLTVHHLLGDNSNYVGDTTTNYKYGDQYEALPDTHDNNYEYAIKDGDSATGVITSNLEVTYYYRKKQATLTIIDVVDGASTTRSTTTVEWGDNVARDEYLAQYDESHNHSVAVSPDVTKVAGDVTVTYTYAIKTYNFTVHHYYDGTTNSYKPDQTSTLNYGATYTATPDTSDNNYEYHLKDGDSASGPVYGPTTVTYYYKKKTATFRVVHQDSQGGTLAPTETTTLEWGDPYEAHPASSLTDKYNYTFTGGQETGTIAGDVTIIYTYTKKIGRITAVHVDANGNQLAEPVTQDIEYDLPYQTEPASSLIQAYNYTTDHPESGTVGGNLTVTYTYTIKTFNYTVHHYYDGTTNSYKSDQTSTLNYGTPYTATPDTSDNNYEYHLKDGDTVTGIITNNTTVTFYYKKKTATLTVVHVVDGQEESRSETTVEWGDDVARDEFISTYNDSHNHSVSVSPDVTKVAGDVTVTYTYTIKSFDFTVHHYYEGTTTSYKPDHSETLNYGASFIATPDTSDNNYEYHIKQGDQDSGIMYGPTTVTFYYKKKTATLTIIDVVDGASTTRSTTTVEWGDDVVRDAYLPLYGDSHNHSVSVSPDVTKVAGDVTVTYTYTIKTFDFTVHHYYDGTTDSYKPDQSDTLNYGEEYTATPDTSNNNYEYHLKDGDTATGYIYSNTTVTYYYKKKTATITVKHQDVQGNELAPTETIPKEWGDPYETHPSSTLTEAYQHTVSGGSESGTVSGNLTIIYIYTKKAYILTVHHLYENGGTYKNDTTTDYEHGDHYTATPDTSDNNYEYRLKEGDSAEGTITSNLEVTFIYKKKTATLTIIDIVDGVSNTRLSTTVEWGDDVVRNDYLSEYNESHDHSVSVSPDVTKVAGDVTVTYTYSIKQYTLTVHHRLENGQQYKPDVTTDYSHGATYTAVPDTSDNNYEYRLANGDSASGPITSDLEVTFIYKKKTATFKVVHQDSQGGTLAPTETTTLEWGDPYEAHPASSLTTEYDYAVDKAETGTISGDVTVTYTYTRKTFTVIVHHVYADGTPFANDDTTTVEYGQPYTATPKNDPSYNVVVTEGSLENDSITSNTVITIKYVLKQGNITVKHLDADGGVLAPEEHYAVDYGSSYSVSPSASLTEAYDYTVNVAESDTVSGDVTVIYTYTKKKYVLTVHHILENGSEHKSDKTYNYEHGDQYTAPADTSDNNYEYRLKEGDSAEGTITSNLEVTYIYKKKLATFRVRHLDKNGNSLVEDEVTQIEWGETYYAYPASSLSAGYTHTVDGEESAVVAGDITITYTYTKKKFTLTIHHVDIDGNQIAEDTEVEVEWGDPYVPSGLADLINDYNFEVDPDTPIPEVIIENGEFTLIYTKKPEVPKTYDNVLPIIAGALITLTGTGAVVLAVKKRRA